MRRSKIACALLVASSAGLVCPFAQAQTQANWLQPSDGSWTDPSQWSTDPFFPNNGSPPGTTYDVLVDATGSPYTISSSGSITIDSLRLHAPGATVQHSGGPFTIAAGSLSIGPQSTFVTQSGGTLTTSADVIIAGGQLQSFSNFNLPSGTAFNVTDGGSARITNAVFTDAMLSARNAASIDFNAAILGGSGGATALGEGPATQMLINVAHVGDAGVGTMTLRDRATLIARPGSIGTRVVVGINGGTGELNISGGAQVRAVHFMSGIDAGVPQYTPGTGTIHISGADTRVAVPGWMVVGPTSGGAGTLVLDSGTLILGGISTPINRVINPTGTMLVRGGVFEANGLTVRGRLAFTGQGTIGHGTFSGLFLSVDGGSVTFEQGWVVPNGSRLSVGNGGTFEAGTVLGATGTGSIHYDNGGHIHAPRIELIAGGRMVLAFGGEKVLRVNSLLIEPASKLDVNNNRAIIDYDAISPLDDVRQWITTGYNGGSWNGNGILSTAAAGNPGFGLGYAEASQIFTSFPALFGGEEVDDTAVLIAYARYGDADLDGQVNLADFNRLAANFGASSGAVWSQGDFTYDGIVNLDDFNRFAANFGLSAGPDDVVGPADWAALAAVVPEPSAAVIASIPALLRRRRWRRRAR
jgi:hypothetical protein